MVSPLQKQLYGSTPVDPKFSNDLDTATRQAKIYTWFQDFGYNATQEEIDSFLILAGGTSQDLQRGKSMVANYVHAVKTAQEAAANDPSRQVLADEQGFFNTQQQRAVKLEGSADQVYAELQGTFGKAPKLFGGLEEGQVEAYLDPVRRLSEERSAGLQTAAARRGLLGSSTEMNALADEERQFRENVLKTGLDIGREEQGVKRQVLQNRINQLQADYQQAYGFLPGSLGRKGSVAQNIGASDMNVALLKGSLPLYLRSYSTNEALAGRQPENQEANFFQKYIVPFLQPAATVIGGSMGGPPGASAGNLLGSKMAESAYGYDYA